MQELGMAADEWVYGALALGYADTEDGITDILLNDKNWAVDIMTWWINDK